MDGAGWEERSAWSQGEVGGLQTVAEQTVGGPMAGGFLLTGDGKWDWASSCSSNQGFLRRNCT